MHPTAKVGVFRCGKDAYFLSLVTEPAVSNRLMGAIEVDRVDVVNATLSGDPASPSGRAPVRAV